MRYHVDKAGGPTKSAEKASILDVSYHKLVARR